VPIDGRMMFGCPESKSGRTSASRLPQAEQTNLGSRSAKSNGLSGRRASR
jgi:hypothetical protein